jgi:hypothetical protein
MLHCLLLPETHHLGGFDHAVSPEESPFWTLSYPRFVRIPGRVGPGNFVPVWGTFAILFVDFILLSQILDDW